MLIDLFNLSKEEKEIILLAATYHDIGKIGVPDAILNSTTKLSDEEFQQIKKHPENSRQILEGLFGKEVAFIAACHHERWDGKGYPYGLKGEEIPFGARLIAIADAYDAMTTNRSYRQSLSKEEAIKRLKEGSGSQFDPTLIPIFINSIKNK